jgi:phosphate/sulfate permease
MWWGLGVGGAVGGVIGFGFSLTTLFSQLAGPANFTNQVIAATILTAITGAVFGGLIASPSCEELSSRGKAEEKRRDMQKLAEANKRDIYFDL